MERGLSTESSADESSEGEEDQDFLARMFPGLEEEEGGESGDKDPQTTGADRSVLEVVPRRGGTQASQRAGGNNNSMVDNSTVDNFLTKLQSMQNEMDLLRQKADIAEALVMNSAQIKELASSSKRDREEGEKRKEKPDEPRLEVWSERGSQAEDDNTTRFAWRCRRSYRQPNAEPEEYWREASYRMEVTPNMRESLVTSHLMPLGLSSRVLGWSHNLLATTAIKYYTHSQASLSAKKRKSNFTIEEDDDDVRQRVVTVGQEWAETSGVGEVLEAVHNWTAVRFQVAPWDWSGLLLLRSLHEMAYFTHVVETEESQRVLLERYVDHYLNTNRRNLMQNKPPLIYRQVVRLAEEVVRSFNGNQDK